ncbi:ATP-binding protein [Zhenpiania hominis]|uniref:ATP-binding protein n=1 Tax=Zhenpiania hominis TaxID=2763644 RepID=UPI0039F624F4
MAKQYATVNQKLCVSCGACQNICPKEAISVWRGCYAESVPEACVGCGLCVKVCPANAITLTAREVSV